MADIAFRDVTKRYADGTQAVTDLSLEIADGEFMILVGPSGCGKSTALRMVAGLEAAGDQDRLVAGVRPENLTGVGGPAPDGRPDLVPVDVHIDVIERMGSESLAYFDAGGDLQLREPVEIADDSRVGDGTSLTRGQIIARIDGRTSLRPGDEARLWLAPDRLHLFDEATGAARR